jgi:hypothetical protein
MAKLTRFMAGTHISEAVEVLIRAAGVSGSAEGEFNEVTITAERGETADAILARYTSECERRTDAYRKSPEGIAALNCAAERTAALQQAADDLMAALPNLDFTDENAVLDWLCALQEPSDHIGISIDKNSVLIDFAKHGLRPNVNCGPDFDAGDRRNFFEWLVGQALDGLATVAIHGVIHKFADDWRRGFAGRSILDGGREK